MQHRQPLFGLVGRAATWPRRLEAWSAAGALPCTVSYCPSIAHLRARLATVGGRQAVLLDGELSVVDRDLLADLSRAGAAAIVVDGARRRRRWTELGAYAILPHGFDQRQLLAVLRPLLPGERTGAMTEATAPLIGVTGPGGTGASVTAIALAQGLAAERGRVVLADCCLHAEQAMLHNVLGPCPGLSELVELHTERTPEPHQTRRVALGIVERGYHLLPGLARARHWSRVGGASLRSAFLSLRSAFDVVLADVDADVEGEAQGGSIEVEERNVLARTVAVDADLIVVVGQASMKGVYALVRVMIELREFGVRSERLLPVINQAEPDRLVRAELSRAVGRLMAGTAGGDAVRPVLFAPQFELEECLRERHALPEAWSTLLAGAVGSVLDRTRAQGPTTVAVERVPAGALGHWENGPEPLE